MQASVAFPRDVPKEQCDCCYSMLARSNHMKAVRADEMVDKVIAAVSKPDKYTC